MEKNSRNTFKTYKKAFVDSEEQPDYRQFKKIVDLGRYIGFTPLNYKDRFILRFAKVSLPLIIYFTVISYVYLTNTYWGHIIIVVCGATHILFAIICCYFVLISVNAFLVNIWYELFSHLNRIEKLLRNLGFSNHSKRLVPIKIWIIFAFYILFFLQNLNTLRVSNDKKDMVLHLLFWNFTHVYEYARSIYVFYTTSLIRRRYCFIKYYLEHLVKDELDQKAIQDVTKFLKLGKKILENINTILGPLIFLDIIHYVSYLCFIITYDVYTNAPAGIKYGSIVSITAVSYCLFIIIKSCQDLEEAGKEVINNLYLLSTKKSNKNLQKAILICAEYATQWRPIISAANFFEVNQLCINSIFSGVIDYLTIVIQFNIMMKTYEWKDDIGKV